MEDGEAAPRAGVQLKESIGHLDLLGRLVSGQRGLRDQQHHDGGEHGQRRQLQPAHEAGAGALNSSSPCGTGWDIQ